MSFFAGEKFDRSVATSVSQAGFRSELFTVAAGSYASNGVYGSSAALTSTYATSAIREKSSAAIRMQDTGTDFSLKVTLDLSGADPVGRVTGDEIRIRTLQPLLSGEPTSYLKRMTLAGTGYGLPLFLDVEIIDPATGAPWAGFPTIAGVGQLQARMLYGGEFALVVANLAVGPPTTVTPLTVGDLNPLFSGGAGAELLVSVRGTYRSRQY